MTLGENIKKLREERNLTQQHLAERLYVSRQTICRWENDSRCPDLFMAKQLAREFGISLDEMLGEDVEQEKMGARFLHTDTIKNRAGLEAYRRKLINAMEMTGSIFLLVVVLCRRVWDISVPLWMTLPFLCVGGIVIVLYLRISRRIYRL